MNKIMRTFGIGIVLALVTFTALATQSFNQIILFFNGSGNPSTGFTVDNNNGITLALRAKKRDGLPADSTLNVDGVYSVSAGLLPPGNNRARWNWEYSINSGAVNLDAYNFYIAIDLDPSVGINPLVTNALSFADNAYGNDATTDADNVSGPAALYAGIYNISQQSQNIVFYGLDPTQNATFDYELYAVASGAGPTGEKLASVSITVIVGTGGASVQDLVNTCAATVLASERPTHGDYVNCVNDLANYLYDGGVLNKKQKQTLLTDAAKSSIGK